MTRIAFLKPFLRRLYHAGLERCPCCGHHTRTRFAPVLWPELVAQISLTPLEAEQMDRREGEHCRYCGCNMRVRILARLFVAQANARTGGRARSVRELVASPAANLRVAEINHLSHLHPILSALPGLTYSEYGSTDPKVPSENLMALSYPDRSFDFVLTSDTLEHVPDFDAALRETWRVLNPGGAHLFTVPILWDRATRQRAEVRDGQVVHLLEPSYHGREGDNLDDWLVFNDFGGDIVDRVRAAGYVVDIVKDAANPLVAAIRAVRPA